MYSIYYMYYTYYIYYMHDVNSIYYIYWIHDFALYTLNTLPQYYKPPPHHRGGKEPIHNTVFHCFHLRTRVGTCWRPMDLHHDQPTTALLPSPHPEIRFWAHAVRRRHIVNYRSYVKNKYQRMYGYICNDHVQNISTARGGGGSFQR